MEIANLELKICFYRSLHKRLRLHFAALEAYEIGHGGIKEVSEAFGISVVMIREGPGEINANAQLPVGRIRKEGGGRKKASKRSYLKAVSLDQVPNRISSIDFFHI